MCASSNCPNARLPTHALNGYEAYECYSCGQLVWVDANNEDINGNNCYFGEDSMGHSKIYCLAHLEN